MGPDRVFWKRINFDFYFPTHTTFVVACHLYIICAFVWLFITEANEEFAHWNSFNVTYYGSFVTVGFFLALGLLDVNRFLKIVCRAIVVICFVVELYLGRTTAVLCITPENKTKHTHKK